AYGFEFIYTFDPYKWWRINGSANFYREIVDGRNFQEDLYQDALTWFTRINSRFTIKKDLNVQLRANYRAPRNTPQGRTESFTTVDIALSKDLFKGNGTFTLGVRDVFNAGIYRSLAQGELFFSESERQWRPRQLTATLNYRLNQKKRRGGSNRSGGGDYSGEGF
ncbi:MAG: outer membrane beta-barrel protein, partial [Bacteroidota bacterium]